MSQGIIIITLDERIVGHALRFYIAKSIPNQGRTIPLARIIHDASTASADTLLRQATQLSDSATDRHE